MSKKAMEHVGGDNLSIGGLHFAYGDTLPIFEDLNVEVKPGEFLAVLGPSGCGKTTLLNLLCGFYNPDEGHVLLRGETMEPEDPHLGYVFQSSNLFPWLTAIENVEFGLKMAHVEPKERRRKAVEYLNLVGLGGFDDYLPGKLSGGHAATGFTGPRPCP